MSMIGERAPSRRLSGARRSWQTSISAPPGDSRPWASRQSAAGSGTCSMVMKHVIRSYGPLAPHRAASKTSWTISERTRSAAAASGAADGS